MAATRGPASLLPTCIQFLRLWKAYHNAENVGLSVISDQVDQLTNDGQERVSLLWIRHNPTDDKKASGSSHGLNWAVLDSRAISISSAFSSPSLTADVGVKRLVDQPGLGTRPRKQRFYHDLLIADPEDRVPRTA